MNYLAPKKSLGQNFLKNPLIAKKIVAAGQVVPGDTVLEIGPGKGALTRELLEAGATVIAIEADARALLILEVDFADAIHKKKLVLHHGDIRKFDLSSLPIEARKYKVIANIPYYISGMLFRTFLSGNLQPSTLVFLVQKEVAERIARSKKESLLSLSVKAYGAPLYITTVARGNFTPVPGVDSAVLAVEHIGRERFTQHSEEFFFTCIHAGFAARRKQLLGALATFLTKSCVLEAFHTLGLDPKVRGEDLSIDTWILLARALERCPHETAV